MFKSTVSKEGFKPKVEAKAKTLIQHKFLAPDEENDFKSRTLVAVKKEKRKSN